LPGIRTYRNTPVNSRNDNPVTWFGDVYEFVVHAQRNNYGEFWPSCTASGVSLRRMTCQFAYSQRSVYKSDIVPTEAQTSRGQRIGSSILRGQFFTCIMCEQRKKGYSHGCDQIFDTNEFFRILITRVLVKMKVA
jgi:hypothetical protein